MDQGHRTRLDVIDLIRDAKLPANVKAILWAVESRGQHFGKWQTLAADAGLSKNAYYGARAKAEELGLLTVTRRYSSSNLYTVNREALETQPRHSPIRERDFPNPGIGFPESENLRNTIEGTPLRGPSSIEGDSLIGESPAAVSASVRQPWARTSRSNGSPQLDASR